MSAARVDGLYRVCVKLYAKEPHGIRHDADTFVPIFHEWIRERGFDMVLFDVADYAHVPDGPGIMLVTHEAAFALDRSDGRFGLFAQRRVPLEGDAIDAVATTLRQTLEVADGLERDPRLAGRLSFDRSVIRVEANDRLRVPNSDEGFAAFSGPVRDAVQRILPDRGSELRRVENDPRDRLAVEVWLASGNGASAPSAA
jgi:hypothetical protein